ncbi:MAG: hypothetical protein IJX69_04460 [Oscillospiraceae bacterium]|nr:hypothetical protein [Oscillospiraceae bacterium]
MESIIATLSSWLPADFDLEATIRLLIMVAIGSLVLGFLGRVCFGKRSDLNHSVSSALGILFIYAVTVVIYTFEPAQLSRLLSPLPFVTFEGEYLYIFPFTESDYPAICSQILDMVILAFLVNLLDSWLPKGKHVISWYFFRFMTVLLAMILQLIVSGLLSTYLPGVLVTYAPMILLGILAFMLLLGLMKVVLGVVLSVVHPLIGALYTFFFASLLGKMISKAVLTTIILTALAVALDYFGYTVFCIASAALAAYLPLVIVLLLLWYLLGHIL